MDKTIEGMKHNWIFLIGMTMIYLTCMSIAVNLDKLSDILALPRFMLFAHATIFTALGVFIGSEI